MKKKYKMPEVRAFKEVQEGTKAVMIDPGTKFGFAVYKVQYGKLQLEEHGRGNCTQERVAGFVSSFDKSSTFFIEEQHVGVNSKTVLKMAWNKNVWEIMCRHFGISTELIQPSQWQSPLIKQFDLRKYSSEEKKKRFAEIAANHYHLDSVKKDEADALCMGIWLEGQLA